MKNRNMVLPILASIGVGAATYYSMRRNNGMGNMMSKMTNAMNQQQ
ncbi:hypothetical protein BN1058_02207 [Paraliobacillus sp. PM-2]|nr:hypothetical protein [Paraliobacillus sp. PM-2]CQR47875.1 hypothetical protein BN1058_02207 [Paraliobacillus sp. PM-2]